MAGAGTRARSSCSQAKEVAVVPDRARQRRETEGVKAAARKVKRRLPRGGEERQNPGRAEAEAQ